MERSDLENKIVYNLQSALMAMGVSESGSSAHTTEEKKEAFYFYVFNKTGKKPTANNYRWALSQEAFCQYLSSRGVDSIYDITDAQEVRKIRDEIMNLDFNMKSKYSHSAALGQYADYLDEMGQSDSTSSTEKETALPDKPRQIITYGAPGTGKSYDTERLISKYPVDCTIRTTFHPDTDYASFVGAYKPVSHKATTPEILSIEELKERFAAKKSTYPNRPEHRFAAEYAASLENLSFKERLVVFEGSSDEVVRAEVPKALAVAEQLASKETNATISYEFVPQAFMKAYVKAWSNRKMPVFLIIEEINRGNCAQIFGDLFQLLDRNDDNMSAYEISTNDDIRSYIASRHLKIQEVETTNGEDISAKIASGELMALPENLYIWATMNTSDQSLFPIDSAFKRRWEWKYVKIAKGRDKETSEEYNWNLESNNIGWWEFVQQINKIIANMTSSADKQLGFFFCKPDQNGIITYDRFVNKVLFYLWNDVFKDYGFEDKDLFTYIDENNKEQDLTFPDFYGETGEEINKIRVDEFVNKVMAWEKTSN